MFEKIYNMKKNKKGFTLVELIVVLVILAILLAILVPALTQWINKARDKQVLISARTVYLAAQTVGSEDYGRKEPKYTKGYIEGIVVKNDKVENASTVATKLADEIAQLADIGGSYKLSVAYGASNEVVGFVYEELNANGNTINGTNKKFVVLADGTLEASTGSIAVSNAVSGLTAVATT